MGVGLGPGGFPCGWKLGVGDRGPNVGGGTKLNKFERVNVESQGYLRCGPTNRHD